MRVGVLLVGLGIVGAGCADDRCPPGTPGPTEIILAPLPDEFYFTGLLPCPVVGRDGGNDKYWTDTTAEFGCDCPPKEGFNSADCVGFGRCVGGSLADGGAAISHYIKCTYSNRTLCGL